MTRKTLLGIFLLITALGTQACFCGGFNLVGLGGIGQVRGSRQVTSETIQLGSFDGVVNTTFGDLHIEYGEDEELRIEAEDNLIEYFETTIENGTLTIRQRNRINIVSYEPVDFYLTVVELDHIRLTGSGDADGPDIKADDFNVELTGSGDLVLQDLEVEDVEILQTGSGDVELNDIETQTIDVTLTGSGSYEMEELTADEGSMHVTGSGDLRIEGGEVDALSVTLSGSGKFAAPDLSCEVANLRLTGSGGASLIVNEQLDAHLTGSGDVYYGGNPRIDIFSSGSGDLISSD